MLHREIVSFDSTNPLVDTLRDSLNEIHRIKTRLTDLQEQLSDVLLQIQSGVPSSFTLSPDLQNSIATVSSVSPTRLSTSDPTLAGIATFTPTPPPLTTIAGMIDQAGDQIADSIDLQKWLLDRGISIRQLVSESPFEESFDRLALRLGRDFEHLGEFYQALKRRIGGNAGPKSISLKNYSAEKIDRVLQFGEELRRNGFLKEFRYVKPTRTILFDPQSDGRVANFITGNWLERYVVITVSQHLRKIYPGQTIEVLTNPRITLPDGSDFELDVLIACDSIVLWFECKTGKDYPAFLAKYGVVAKKVMRLAGSNAAMILLEELTDLEKNNNSQLAGMSVLNLKDVQRFLNAIKPARKVGHSLPAISKNDSLELSVQTPPSPPGPTALRVPPLRMNFTEWLAVLNREQLRPLEAQVRRQIMEDFIAIRNATAEPIPLRNFVNRLATQYADTDPKLSKAMINDIARALYRCGCCELGFHCDYPNKVWFLRNDTASKYAFDATASLYLWACIKARESFQLESAESNELARVIWGGQTSDSDAMDLIARSISELESAGRCAVECDEDRSIVIAIGDRFWDQPADIVDNSFTPKSIDELQPYGDA